MSFELVSGVYVENCEDVHSAYSVEENGVYAVLSAELIKKILAALAGKLEEKIFFFVEIPCSDEREKTLRKNKSDPYHYDIYYLDNCTLPVAEAIVDRYGELLVNDGVVRFGFGSHANGEEIYCRRYQTLSVYGGVEKVKTVFDKLGVPCESKIKTLWDVFSEDNSGVCSTVEVNGETVMDMIENLKTEGMYLAETAEEK